MSTTTSVPFHVPSIGNREIRAVSDVLRSGWLTTGSQTAQFETEFKNYVQAAAALAVNSGTAGLHLALAALDIGPGDEVITTPLTFCATVTAIMHTGATPVLADIGQDGNIDPGTIARRITKRTRAIIPVHLAGLPCDMNRIHALATGHGLHVIEDAAHAVGTYYHGKPIGADPRSRAVVFSFYATKNLTTGEGGMVTTHDPKLLERMRTLCLHGINKDAWNRYSEKGNWFYEVTEAGYKYNLSDVQSAIGIPQLQRQEEFIAVRRRYAERYSQAFAGMSELEVPPNPPDIRHCWHLYILRLHLDRLEIDRDRFIMALRERGIGCSVHFIPVPLHPFFKEHAAIRRNLCPRALALYPRIVSLPLYPRMRKDQLQLVISSVRDVARLNRKQKFSSMAMSAH